MSQAELKALSHREFLHETAGQLLAELTNTKAQGCPPLTYDLHNDALDSLDCVQFMIMLEEKFFIEIADDDFAKCKTLGDVVDYLVSQGC